MSVTPQPAPAAPTAASATPADSSAVVSWTAPVANGGPAITGYTATAVPGGATCTTATTTCTIVGLTNGTAYSVTVVASNSIGAGPASSPPASVTPHPLVPGAPTGVSAAPKDSSAVVSWTAPAANGSAAVTGYTASASPGGASCTTATTTCTISGLTNGTAYTVTVVASNSIGAGPASSPPVSVTPQPAPAASTGVSAAPKDSSAVVSWTAPAANGGPPVTGYTATAIPGSASCTTAATTCTIVGLTNGTAYTVTVVARNSIGAGPASSPPVPVTPQPAPAAPTGVSATAGDATATVTWTAPAPNGSAAVTGYTATASPGGASCATTTATTCTITGLVNSTAYTVTVVAANGFGNGPASAPAVNVPRYTCRSAAAAASSYFTYALDETSGTAAADASGNSRPGTYTATGITYSATGPCSRDTGKAVTLNGTTGSIVGAATPANPQTFSMAIWFKTAGGGSRLIGLGSTQAATPSATLPGINITAPGKLTFNVAVGGATTTITSPSGYKDSLWHYAVASLAPSTDASPGMRLYVDGALVASDASKTAVDSATGSYWRIGSTKDGNAQTAASFFAGSLAFASAYTYGLTPAQVLAQYHAGI